MSTKSIEQEKRSSINIVYPQDYLDGFSQPNEKVVQKYFEYLYDNGLKEKARAIVVSPTGRNETETVVYLVTYEGSRFSSEEINWGQPGRKPNSYEGHGRGDTMFHLLSGNYDIQLKRALLLSRELKCFIGEIPFNIFKFTGLNIAGSGRLFNQKAEDIIFINGIRPPRIASLFDSD